MDAMDADASGFEPIWRDDKVVGFTTSGGYGHTTGKSLAMGYVDADAIDRHSTFEIHVLGEKRAAKLLKEPPYDPEGLRLRGK
ncbi:glycine cleavage T C-terminal barrel domain-containing protein [Burkholderia sp. Ac-20353]|uniref:glycine cleavage T C-terminal barrel domain-containing protein n=1 Tax=Burkholderia sp. Ac-20353 TaxID=2703894 RepID=UPI003217A3F3